MPAFLQDDGARFAPDSTPPRKSGSKTEFNCENLL